MIQQARMLRPAKETSQLQDSGGGILLAHTSNKNQCYVQCVTEHRGKNKFWVQMQVKRYFNKHKRQTLSKNRTETINTGRQSGGSVVFK